MADLAQKKLWLAEAESARHKIATQGGTVKLQHDDRVIEVSNRSLTKINEYIGQLKSEIANLEGASRRRGMRVYF